MPFVLFFLSLWRNFKMDVIYMKCEEVTQIHTPACTVICIFLTIASVLFFFFFFSSPLACLFFLKIFVQEKKKINKSFRTEKLFNMYVCRGAGVNAVHAGGANTWQIYAPLHTCFKNWYSSNLFWYSTLSSYESVEFWGPKIRAKRLSTLFLSLKKETVSAT